MRKGFSLIELLVVVLIMGILASVAMPQYFNTVEKSRASEGIQTLKTLRDQQAACISKNPDGEGCMQGAPGNNLFTYADGINGTESPICDYGTTAGPATQNWEYWADGQYIVAIRRPCNKYTLETTAYKSNWNDPEVNRIGCSNDGDKDWCAILGCVVEGNRYFLQ